jgi:GNAT superfamily N-acetyltransferase
MKNRRTLVDLHMPTCVLKHPPGREIYREEDPPSAAVGAGAGAAKRSSPHRSSKRDGSSSSSSSSTSSSSSSLTPNAVVYEVNGGGMDKVYCQHLSLLGKLFLQHKSVTFDVDYFNFYVLCEVDAATGREHFVGFFSKEKNSARNHNLACLLVLPSHQGKSYGKLLISVSYELSKREGNFLASPEKPLSDLAKTTYDRYWAFAVFKNICNRGVNQGCTYDDIVLSTGISLVDVFNTLEKLMDPQHTHRPISIVEGDQVSKVSNFFEPASPGSPGFGSPPKRPKNGKRRATVPYVKTVEFKLDAPVLHRLGSYFDISAPKIRLCNPSCFH